MMPNLYFKLYHNSDIGSGSKIVFFGNHPGNVHLVAAETIAIPVACRVAFLSWIRQPRPVRVQQQVAVQGWIP